MLNLGTKKHKDKYYEGIDNLEYTGCFAMTELHHGMFYLQPLYLYDKSDSIFVLLSYRSYQMERSFLF